MRGASVSPDERGLRRQVAAGTGSAGMGAGASETAWRLITEEIGMAMTAKLRRNEANTKAVSRPANRAHDRAL